ncbi:MAG: ABC transporter permease [Acidobacteria bacterium]|nr:ABC transporter permease [Acidobacteriota bacterium]
MMEPIKAVFALAMRVQLRTKRTLVLSLVSALPIAGTLLFVAASRLRLGEGAQTVVGAAGDVMTFFYLSFLLLAITLFYATAIIGDEIEEKTITYLFVRPVPRSTIFLGKFLAALTLSSAMILSSASISFSVLLSADSPAEAAGHVGIFLQDLAILALGTVAYSALFGFIGARFKRALLIGLAFALTWETAVTYLPGYLGHLTVMHYLQSLLPHPSGQRGVLQFFQAPTSTPVAILTLAAITAGFVALACYTVSRKQYVLEA